MQDINWDESFDAVVVGTGASGMCAALTAHLEGLKVLLVEKTDRIGGSTAISGGAVWLPLNAGAQAAGHPDSYDKVWEYLAHTVGDASPDHMKHAFLRHAAAMQQYMAAHGVLQLAARSYSPDYYPDLPGASLGGRSLDPLPFDGRKLGRHFRELRDPLKEFVVLGGMMVNVSDVYHLLNATKSVRSLFYTAKLVLRYVMDRMRGYHRGTRLLLGNALAAQLFHAVLQHGIAYWLQAPATKLHRDAGGRITGVAIRRGGKQLNVQARKGVVIATGGFPWNAAMREQLYPKPTGMWSMAPQANQGDGIQLAIEAGAELGRDHVWPAFWAPVSLLTLPDGQVVRYPHLVWDRAKPGLIAVDAGGRRFVNEATSYHEFVVAMYRAGASAPAIPAYLLCDSDFIEKWGLGLALPGGQPRQHLIDAGYLVRASSIEDLARQIGVDAQQLARTVARYNEQADAGQDSDFGKGDNAYNRYLGAPDHEPNPCLAPLRKPPYYAVKVVAGDIGTACGIKTDEQARALRGNGEVIEGLFVVGNDMQSVMGGAYPGPGITLGPGLTFGWIAGRRLAGKSINSSKDVP